jgi:hypothetical protein
MAIDKCLFKRAPGACILTERGESKPTLAESKVASAGHQTLEQRARERGLHVSHSPLR